MVSKYVTISILTSQPKISLILTSESDTIIIAEVTRTQDEDLEGDEDGIEDKKDKITRPTAEQVRTAITVLEDLSIFSHFGEAMMASLKDLNYNIKKDFDISCKQTVITDFFSD